MATWILPDMLRLIRHDLSPSTSLHSRKMVRHCSTLYVSVSRLLVLPNGTKLSESDALTIPTLQKQVSKSEPGTTWGSHQIVQHRQPTDLLALRCKETCTHVNTWVHTRTDMATQLPWQQPPPLNNGAANSTGEERTDLPCRPQGASVQVQRQTRLFCHLHYAQSEDQKNNNDMNSSDYEDS